MPLLWFVGPGGDPFQCLFGSEGINVLNLAKKLHLREPLELNGVVLGISGCIPPAEADSFLHGLGDTAERAIRVTGEPAAGPIPAGPSAGSDVGPRYKRPKETLSECAQPDKVKKYTPTISNSTDQRAQACFMAGREVELAFSGAVPALLLAPEFGVVHDAAYLATQWTPPDWSYKAASALLDCMAVIYTLETERHTAFLAWHRKWLPFELVYHRSGSTSSGGQEKHCNDGEYVLPGHPSYLGALQEVKNELTADPTYQLMRYVQTWYGDRAWDRDPVMCALGAPVLAVDLAGPNLIIHGMYTAHADCIVGEALTPRVLLTQQAARQPRHLHLLAAVLGGYVVAVWALLERIAAAAEGSAALPAPKLAQQADQVLQAMDTLGVRYKEILVGARLNPKQVERLVSWRVNAAPSASQPALLLPYPLLSSSISRFDSMPQLLREHDTKLVYSATGADGKPHFIKFTTRSYPKHVHEAWQTAGLVLALYMCQALPGGYNLVVMEMLGPEWVALWQVCEDLGSSSCSDTERGQCMAAVKKALQHDHSIKVEHGGIRAHAVHGDCRGPNIMVRWINDASGSSGSGSRDWNVRFVDLDWAGLEGVARYPGRMSDALPWHGGAKPGCLLYREHDTHLLQQRGTHH